MTKGYSHVCRTGFPRARLPPPAVLQSRAVTPPLRPRRSGQIRSSPCTAAARSTSADRAARDRADLSLAYTPGSPGSAPRSPSTPELADDTPGVANTVAVVTDGTAVLGLGDIGPAAAMPVMEGKALLFKQFAGVDAVPICLALHRHRRDRRDRGCGSRRASAASTWRTSRAPRCFEIERAAARAARHPGLPRRPARHRDRRAGRAAQRRAGDRARTSATCAPWSPAPARPASR